MPLPDASPAAPAPDFPKVCSKTDRRPCPLPQIHALAEAHPFIAVSVEKQTNVALLWGMVRAALAAPPSPPPPSIDGSGAPLPGKLCAPLALAANAPDQMGSHAPDQMGSLSPAAARLKDSMLSFTLRTETASFTFLVGAETSASSPAQAPCRSQLSAHRGHLHAEAAAGCSAGCDGVLPIPQRDPTHTQRPRPPPPPNQKSYHAGRRTPPVAARLVRCALREPPPRSCELAHLSLPLRKSRARTAYRLTWCTPCPRRRRAPRARSASERAPAHRTCHLSESGSRAASRTSHEIEKRRPLRALGCRTRASQGGEIQNSAPLHLMLQTTELTGLQAR